MNLTKIVQTNLEFIGYIYPKPLILRTIKIKTTDFKSYVYIAGIQWIDRAIYYPSLNLFVPAFVEINTRFKYKFKPNGLKCVYKLFQPIIIIKGMVIV